MTSPFQFCPVACDALPKLGWIASVPLEGGAVHVLHGPAVECRDGWLVEGVWDSPFERGEFHRSQAFFGSGLSLVADEVVASASTAMVDRLLYLQRGARLLISNSLVLMLAASGSRLQLAHDYRAECSASLQGIHRQPYPLTVAPTTGPALQQCFHGNLVVAGGSVQLRMRTAARHFPSFEDYTASLRGTLRAVQANGQSPQRTIPVRGGVTLSSGYDSVAVACLAQELGVRDCYTTRPDLSAKGWVALEDGAAIATVLGLDARLLHPPSSATSAMEQWFLAPTVWGSELIFHDLASTVAGSGALAAIHTGYHGDKVWDLHTGGRHLADDIVRGDTSGLNLSEVRLASGFFNVAVPFLHARAVRSLVDIAGSAAMSPWRVGGDYDRPIPRRIAEEAGVPRHLFGQRKRVVMSYYQHPFNPALQGAFRAWLDRQLAIGRGRVAASEWLDAIDWRLGAWLDRSGAGRGRGNPARSLKRQLLHGHDLRHLMFKWAANDLADQLAAQAGPAGLDRFH